jgi:hypothetical protein
MKIRRSHAFTLWARLFVAFLVAGVISPHLVWCQESDGRVNVEYGHCKAIHAPDSASQFASVATTCDSGCGPCFDTPLFTVGLNQNYSYHLAGLIVEMAGIALYSLPTDNSDILPITAVSSGSDDINPSLLSIQSTVLLI